MTEQESQPNHGRIIKSAFRPPWWAKNRHVQTIWPRFLQRRKAVDLSWQRLELEDGDFVDLAWTPQPQKVKGIAVLFHGLEGSVKSHYANDMLSVLHQEGWRAVMMHFRGCSGESNRLPRAYHSGDTGDALSLLQHLEEKFPHLPKVGLGFSLGANMLLKLLGEHPGQSWLKGAVAISPPFRLANCSESISQGFSRFYQKYLLNSMCEKLLLKMQKIDYRHLMQAPAEKVKSLRSFYDFDQLITAPLHGFKSAEEYYQKCSAVEFSNKIQTPTLILHAKDDPFMNEAVVPMAEELSPSVTLELSDNGGHVGFLQGNPWNSRVWLHERVPQFFQDIIK